MKKIILFILLAAVIAAFYFFDLGEYFTLNELKSNRDRLIFLYEQHRLIFILGYIAVYTLTAFSLPIAAVLTIAGGAIFGVIPGTFFAIIGATTGAILAFFLARNLFRGWVLETFGKSLGAVNQGISKNGLSYLLFLRMVPLFPFFLVNIACGITNIRTGTYILGTIMGSIPGSLVYANAGATIATIHSLRDVTGPRVMTALALLGLISLIPVFYRITAGRKGSQD